MVSICCITYNQEPYIRQCIEGFLMQKTTFPFEILIHDDASTDNTAHIIREYEHKYPDIIKPIYQTENQYSKRIDIIQTFQFPRSKGKYIAFCEGDDYWTNPYKLQKQVIFLESHQEYGMCYTDFNVLFQDSGEIRYALMKNKPNIYPSHYELEEFVYKRGYVAPPTWVFKRDLLEQLDFNLISVDGSFVFFTHFLAISRVKALPDVTATYRTLRESASHSSDYNKIYNREKEILATQYKLIDHYHLNKDLKQKCLFNYYKNNLAQFVGHNKSNDISDAKQVIIDQSLKDKILFLLAKSSIGRRFVLKAKRIRNLN